MADKVFLKCSAKQKRFDNGEALVEIEWWGTNQRGEKNCNGTALVRLPSRDVTLRC